MKTTFTIQGSDGPYRIYLNRATQVLNLDLCEPSPWTFRNSKLNSSLPKSTHEDGIRAIVTKKSFELPLVPTAADLPGDENFVSAAVFAMKSKTFNDELYASIERNCQYGFGHFIGKQSMLQGMSRELIKYGLFHEEIDEKQIASAIAHLTAAAHMGGLEIEGTRWSSLFAKQIIRKFLNDEFKSKPIGFYTTSIELKGIFQQDRLLQEELPNEIARVLAAAIKESPCLLESYRLLLTLISRLTNPLAKPSLLNMLDGEPLEDTKSCILPPSHSHEAELIKKLYGDKPIPEGFQLLNELISRVKNNQLSLVPTKESGWYDHQIYALEPFIRPEQTAEAAKLNFGPRYKIHLDELFRSLFAMTRETHIKQLEGLYAGAIAPQVIIKPKLTQEPIAEYYTRQANSYRFLRQMLQDLVGTEALSEMTLRPLEISCPENVREIPMLQGLLEMESLFRGAYLLTCEQIGMIPTVDDHSERENLQDICFAQDWIKHRFMDRHVGGDVRSMIPLFFDEGRQQTKVLVILGWTFSELEVTFAQSPTVHIQRHDTGEPCEISPSFRGASYTLAQPITAEIYVNKLLDRTEFRTLCDTHKLQSQILAALQAK